MGNSSQYSLQYYKTHKALGLDLSEPKIKEDTIHKQIANYLSTITQFNQFKEGLTVFWTYNASGEYRKPATGALLKAKGLKRGIPDYMIVIIEDSNTDIIWVEAKTKTGKQTKEQIEFENRTKKSINEHYYIVRSVDDLEELLKRLEVVKS